MKISNFESIEAWKKARILTRDIYAVSSQGKFARDYSLRDQIRRASVSIMANISEGFDSQSDTEFVRYLIFSRRSASEVQSHLYVALDQEYISKDKFDQLYGEITAIKNLIYGFIRYLKKSRTSDVGHRTNKTKGAQS